MGELFEFNDDFNIYMVIKLMYIYIYILHKKLKHIGNYNTQNFRIIYKLMKKFFLNLFLIFL